MTVEQNLIVEYINKYGHDMFREAVRLLNTNEILIETQLPFLTRSALESRNFATIKEILKIYHYDYSSNLVLFGCEVENIGWVSAICVMGNQFHNLQDVKKEVRSYFAVKQMRQAKNALSENAKTL